MSKKNGNEYFLTDLKVKPVVKTEVTTFGADDEKTVKIGWKSKLVSDAEASKASVTISTADRPKGLVPGESVDFTFSKKATGKPNALQVDGLAVKSVKKIETETDKGFNLGYTTILTPGTEDATITVTTDEEPSLSQGSEGVATIYQAQTTLQGEEDKKEEPKTEEKK